MKDRKDKSRVPIMAAGGIVLRCVSTPQFAIVQLRKLGAWGLPKGKLAAGEDAITAARREVLEETGHHVTIHEFLGTLAYEASRRPKVVQFWRMQAIGEPIGDLMRDVTAVRWLALEDAIDQLTHLREQVFLEHVGPIALKFAEQSARRAVFRGRPAGKYPVVRRAASDARIHSVGEGVPLAPATDCNPIDRAKQIEREPMEQDLGGRADLVPTADVSAPARLSGQSGQAQETETGVGRGLIGKTWVWFRHATMPHRQPLD
jgi:8-oxo-dGTP diphosphatase